jgi:hypothetical protein
VLPGDNGDGVLQSSSRKDANSGMVHRLAGIIHKPSSCGILPHNREERQDAASTNGVYAISFQD